MTTLAVIGSRSLANKKDEIMAYIDSIAQEYQVDTIISGGADGPDTFGHEYAEKHGLKFVPALPKTDKWATGYKPRNQYIARNCDVCLCFYDRKSPTYGAHWTYDYAKTLGKIVILIEYN